MPFLKIVSLREQSFQIKFILRCKYWVKEIKNFLENSFAFSIPSVTNYSNICESIKYQKVMLNAAKSICWF